MLRRLLNVFAALAALAGMAAGLHAILPFPVIEQVTPKLRFFAAHKDEFDTVFVGTSRIQHQLEPAIFDRVTGELGRPTRSFNFAIDDMHPPENFFLFDEILKLKPTHLRSLIVEFEDIQSEPSPGMRGTRRLAYWHDWPRTSLALRRIIDPKGNGRWPAKLIRTVLRHHNVALHLSLWAKESVNVGRVAELLVRPTATDEAQLGPRQDGFRLPRAPMAPAQVPRYEQKLARETSNARPRFIDPYAEKTFREYAAKFHALGANSVFLVTPVVTQSPLRFRQSPPPPGPLLSFNDAHAYPQLYAAAIRADEAHLSQEGANEFSRLVATEFVRTAR
ncbi:MAG: hypothetical protein M3Z64_07375 [Verrucomicrobiota bacterium]|nr:hypothetical protein [Verrucomicrobiota bacterium]